MSQWTACIAGAWRTRSGRPDYATSRSARCTASTSTSQAAPLDHYGSVIDEPFVINLADAPAIGAPRGATFVQLEPDGVIWPDTGIDVQIMRPRRVRVRRSQLDAFLAAGERPAKAVLREAEDDIGPWEAVRTALEAAISAVNAQDLETLERSSADLSDAVHARRA